MIKYFKEAIMSFDDLSDAEIDRRIKKAVELEREGLKVMGIPLVEWDDELDCVVKIMPDGTKIKLEKYEVANGK